MALNSLSYLMKRGDCEQRRSYVDLLFMLGAKWVFFHVQFFAWGKNVLWNHYSLWETMQCLWTTLLHKFTYPQSCLITQLLLILVIHKIKSPRTSRILFTD
jgi:hypothetical protein